MGVEFKNSKTKENLMRAFAGESQARNRYAIGASQARKEKIYVVASVFNFTAQQEKEHAEIFYQYLSQVGGESISIDGTYPVDLKQNLATVLRYAQHNEYEEHDDVYKNFGDVAKEEGFLQIASTFYSIAKIEKIHGNRFGKIAELLETDKLFVSDVAIDWMCLNCGFVFNGTKAPEKCPVCDHDKGYFIRVELSPFTCLKML